MDAHALRTLPARPVVSRRCRWGWASACLAAGLTWPAVAWAQAAAAPSRGAAPEERILVQAWAQAETTISSPSTGLITHIPTRLGARFAKGEVLLGFDCTENQAKAQIAQAELTAAVENHEAKIRLKAMEAASEIEVTQAAAQVAKAQGQVNLSQHLVSQCAVSAPFDGFVVRITGRAFQTATVGQPLLEIISAEPPRLRVSASSRFFTRMRIGTTLRVFIEETGQAYEAEITAINARIDPVNQTFEMEARVLNPGPNLLPGMSGTAQLAGPRSARPAAAAPARTP